MELSLRRELDSCARPRVRGPAVVQMSVVALGEAPERKESEARLSDAGRESDESAQAKGPEGV